MKTFHLHRPLSWRSVPRLFSQISKRSSLHWVIVWEMPVKCVVLIHMVIDFRAHCWTTGQFCPLLSDIWEAHSPAACPPLSLLSIQVARKFFLKSMSNRISSLRIFQNLPISSIIKAIFTQQPQCPLCPTSCPPSSPLTSPTLYTAFLLGHSVLESIETRCPLNKAWQDLTSGFPFHWED